MLLSMLRAKVRWDEISSEQNSSARKGGTKYRKPLQTFSVVFGTKNLTLTLTLNENYRKQVGI